MEIPRPKKTTLRARFDAEKDSVIELGLKKAESWAKKVGNGQSGVLLDDIPTLLDVLGLKIVDKGQHCVPLDEFEAYRTLALKGMTLRPKLDQDFE